MIDIVSYLKNIALVIGTKKADEAVDGATITRQVLEQIQKFTKDQKKTDIIKDGALKNFLREMYSGLFSGPGELRPDLVEWCASLNTGVPPDGRIEEKAPGDKPAERGNQGRIGPSGHK